MKHYQYGPTLALLAALAILACSGCSATGKITDAALETDRNGEAIQTNLNNAVKTGEVGPKALPFVQKAGEYATAIRALASRILVEIPKVENREWTGWATLKWASIAAAIVALLILLWQTGVLPLIRAALTSLGWFIPKATQSWAKLTAEGKHSEATAALRTDPLADRAYQTAKEEVGSSGLASSASPSPSPA